MSARLRTVQSADPEYPRRLAATPDAPASIHVHGSLVESDKVVAIVGARAAAKKATDAAAELAHSLAARGIAVISGGAVGIDAAAHRGALDGGGYTLAVLGSGLDVEYPARNRPLFASMREAGGALVSIFPCDAPPRAGHFVKRNRVIAGLADLVVVAAASARSGALHTAGAARDYGRPVLAMPGTPGCDALLGRGAGLAERPDDVLAALAGAQPRRRMVQPPAPGSLAAQVLAALDNKPRDEDALVDRTGLSPDQVAEALTGLEVDGLVVLLPGRSYVRSTLAQEQTLG